MNNPEPFHPKNTTPIQRQFRSTKTSHQKIGWVCRRRAQRQRTEPLADSIDQEQFYSTEMTKKVELVSLSCALKTALESRVRHQGRTRESLASETSDEETSDGETSESERISAIINEEITIGTQKAKSIFSSACICRVPENLREVNNSAYTAHLNTSSLSALFIRMTNTSKKHACNMSNCTTPITYFFD